MFARNRRLTITAAVTLASLCGWFCWFTLAGRAKSIEPLPESSVELTLVEKGATYKLVQGRLYQVHPVTGKWAFDQQIYNPDYYVKNYSERDSSIHRKVREGEYLPVKRTFTDDFEGAGRLADLIDIRRGWTSCELQSPKAPTVDDYVKLRNRILKGESDFLDNRIEPSGEVVHGGRSALKTIAMPPTRAMVTAKSSLSTELVHYVKGDDVWMSMWCHVPLDSRMPFTVLDLETTWLRQHPGIRIVIADGKHLCFQLKGFEQLYYRQPAGREVAFPKGRWVQLKAHLTLTEQNDGVIELWQDEQKIIDARGRTLLLSHMIYNSFEVGISAYNEQGGAATLYVDDVAISDQPLQ